MENSLKKSTIDVDAFLPFGSLIEIGNERKKFTINNGYCERFDEIATVEIEGNEAKPIISIFSAKPRKRPIKIDYLEIRNMINLSKNFNKNNFKIFIAYYNKKIRLIDNF